MDLRDWIGRNTTSEAYLEVERANHMLVTLDRNPDFREGHELPPGEGSIQLWASSREGRLAMEAAANLF